MKRLLGTLLTLCLLLSCMLAFTACGGTGKGMTKEEWNAALDLTNATKIACTIDYGDCIREVKYNGESYSEIMRSPESEETTSDTRWIKDGDDYLVYHKEGDDAWQETTVTARDFSEALAISSSTYFCNYAALFPLEQLTLNGNTGIYEAAEVSLSVDGAIGDLGYTYYNVKITLENKKVARIEYTDAKQMHHVLTFAFDGIEIVAPIDPRPVGPLATEEAWNAALDLSAFDNVSIVQMQGNTAISTFKWDGTNLYTEASGVCILVIKEGDSYYTYTKMPNTGWGEKTSATEATYNAYINAYLKNSEIYHFDDFRYDPTEDHYEADAIDQTGDGVTVTITDVRIHFTDNKPDTISYSYAGSTMVMTYSYTDVTIDIP